MRRSLVAGAAAAVALAAPARAVVLDEDELADTSTEVGAIVRAFSFLTFGEVLEPPTLPDDLNPSGVGVFDLRLYAARRGGSYKVVVHDQLTSAARSHGLSSGLAIGRGLPPPRWLPLRWELADEPTLGVVNTVDWAYVAVDRGPVTITVGRQPVSFGRGKLWSPTDVISTFALTEVDTEYKPGTDAARVDWTVAERAQVTAVAAVGELEPEDDGDLGASVRGSSFVARGQRGWDGGELGVMVGYVRGDPLVAVDGVWDAGGFEVYGEAVATLVTGDGLGSAVVDDGGVATRAVLGATYKPTGKLTLVPELAYNGFGAWDDADYAPVALSDRVAVGEQIFLGRLYASAAVDWELHPLIHVSGAALVNLRDPSALATIAVRGSLGDNAEAAIGGYVPAGETPELPAIGSEYGVYPHFVFATVKAAL